MPLKRPLFPDHAKPGMRPWTAGDAGVPTVSETVSSRRSGVAATGRDPFVVVYSGLQGPYDVRGESLWVGTRDVTRKARTRQWIDLYQLVSAPTAWNVYQSRSSRTLVWVVTHLS